MKKLLSLSPSKIYLVCGLGLLMTLGSFWHSQMNQTSLDRMNILNGGVSTCFNRVSQTFTAMMIKDIQSPYLNRGFMALSDECLNETIKGINPFKKNVGKGYQTLNQLISEVHWFHEKVLKIHSPMLVGKDLNASLTPLSDRFSKMENYKMNLMDEIDANSARIREVQQNDEYLMGAGLILFVLSLSLLSLQEFNRLQLNREIEKEALNLLNAGQANVGAMVDRLVERALTTQGMPVTLQIFKDYHGDMLERTSVKTSHEEVKGKETPKADENQIETIAAEVAAPEYKTSLKEVMVSIQNIQPKELIQASDVRDVQLNVPYESFEQTMNAAINQLAARRTDNKKIMISNQVHSDRSIINLFLADSIYTAAELEFASNENNVAIDGIDMNMIILKEMVQESGAKLYMENKADRNGNVTGMSIRLIVNRVAKDTRKNLVSVIKGKKKDLTRELMN